MKLYVFLVVLAAVVEATDFTCATTESAVCCKAQADDFSKCMWPPYPLNSARMRGEA